MSGPGQSRIDAHGAFATPIVSARFPGSAELNVELKRVVLARKASSPGTSHSNLGGWQSSWDLDSWGGPPCERLLQVARDLADKLTCDRQGKPVKVAWRLNAWANVNESGHGNEFHTHPGSFWSGTYYVDDGGIADDPALGGEFEFQDPRGVAPAMYAPHLAFNLPGGQSVGASETVRPQAGLMLMFPAWLSHAVRPYRGTGTRISIAFNLSI